MKQAYFDESNGTANGQPLLVIAGFVAEEDRWAQFCDAWNRDVLQKFGILHFHTKELRSGNHRLYRHRDQPARKRLLTTLVSIVAGYTESAFSIYMRPSDWANFTAPEERSKWGSCYGVCFELLLGSMSQSMYGGDSPQRVSIFVEDGHKNAEDALRRIQAYRYDTEPIELPASVKEYTTVESDPIRLSSMRIGEFGLVPKTLSPQVQAADFLAYLVAAYCQKQPHPIFDGVLDSLLSLRSVVSMGWGPQSIVELIEGIRKTEKLRAEQRERIWQVKRYLRQGHGVKVYELPWGIVVEQPCPDEVSKRTGEQITEILDRLKGKPAATKVMR